ncbi:hypothetical protein KGQ31_02660, partial [Patescibacteria group bacterium]|nr:hypothetical protein [Patescibacteria group bacterium]
GKLRWFIRRPVKLTFTVCRCNWVELVKIDTDPISLWHCLWVKFFKKDQYVLDDQRLSDAVRHKIRQLYLSGCPSVKLDPQATDTPPLSLSALFTAYFETLSDLLN